jgi:hypothetical protein
VPTTPADQNGCACRLPSPFRAAFSVTQTDRHPHRYFRGLLGLHTLRPTGSLSRPRRPLSQGFSPLLSKPPVSYSIKPATIEVESSSTGNTRLRGALGKGAALDRPACDARAQIERGSMAKCGQTLLAALLVGKGAQQRARPRDRSGRPSENRYARPNVKHDRVRAGQSHGELPSATTQNGQLSSNS